MGGIYDEVVEHCTICGQFTTDYDLMPHHEDPAWDGQEWDAPKLPVCLRCKDVNPQAETIVELRGK